MSVEKQLIWYDDQFLTWVNDFLDDSKLNRLRLACIMLPRQHWAVASGLTRLPFPLLFYHHPVPFVPPSFQPPSCPLGGGQGRGTPQKVTAWVTLPTLIISASSLGSEQWQHLH